MATKKATTNVASNDADKILNTGSEPVVKETDLKEEVAELRPEPEVQNVEPVAPSNKVEVDASVLQNILAELNDLKTKQGQLEQTASQDQIRKIEQMRASGKLVKAVKIRRIDGKIVLAWKMVTDDVYYADGKVYEKQEYEVTFEGGEKKVVDIREFTRKGQYESYEVIKEAKLANGTIEYTLQMADGKELVILETYVN